MTNIYSYRCLLLLTAIAIPAAMAAFTITGRITERITADPLPIATYHIYKANDTIHPVVNDVTDADGYFKTDIPDNGKYILRAEYTAKKTKDTPFTIDGADVTIPDIALDELGETLSEVTVVARKDLISSDGSKLTYDAERDPEAATNTIMEMLRKVPMVTVDGDDNILVKGNSNFKIYINGKEDPMLSGDPKNILKSMPASIIKKIEVITDPGSKYDAEGTAGILNIITDRKQSIEGYLATIRATISKGGYNGSIYARTKYRNVTGSVNLYGYNGDIMRAHGYSSSERENFASDTERYYRSNGRQLTKYHSTGGNINLSWEPDTLNLFTLSANFYDGKSRSRATQDITMSDIDNNLRWGYTRDLTTDSPWHGWTTSLSYQHTFPNNPAHTLTATYQFDFGGSDFASRVDAYDITGIDNLSPYQRRRQKSSYGYHTIQLDYSIPFNPRHSLDAGGKAVIRSDKSKDSQYDGPDPAQESLIQFMDIRQINDLYALYLSYNASFGKFSTRAGVRYEHTRLGLRYNETLNTPPYSDFTSRLNDIVPNASITYRLTDIANLRLAYAMRISRPSLSQLNPYVNTLTYGELSYGNPDLTSTHANSVELKYTSFGNKLGIEAGISYAQNNDLITSYGFITDGILHSTYANYGRRSQTAASAYLSYQFTQTMDASLYLAGNYTDYKAPAGTHSIANSGWGYVINANYNVTLPADLRLSLNGGGGSGWVGAQYQGSDWWYYGINLSRSFLPGGPLNITLNASNILPARFTARSTQRTDTSLTRSSYNYSQWSVALSVSYRLGNLSSDVKRTRARIQNDDIATDQKKE